MVLVILTLTANIILLEKSAEKEDVRRGTESFADIGKVKVDASEEVSVNFWMKNWKKQLQKIMKVQKDQLKDGVRKNVMSVSLNISKKRKSSSTRLRTIESLSVYCVTK